MSTPREPLAARMRPMTLDEVTGQKHLLAPGAPLRAAIEEGASARCCSGGGRVQARPLSHDSSHATPPRPSCLSRPLPMAWRGCGELWPRRRRGWRRGGGRSYVIDEIHRYNRGQQDAFLPHVEAGTVTLIGATTENPSSELNAALLSRLQVHVLQPLSVDDVRGRCRARSRLRSEGWGDRRPGAKTSRWRPRRWHWWPSMRGATRGAD